MKRPNSFDSLTGDFNGDEMGCEADQEELSSQVCAGVGGAHGSGEKKRRLSTEQVRALEKNFELENKLEPDRKVKLAVELGLQPRQVAVWFQNRRARWKAKQLERDYDALRSNYDSLKLSYDALRQDKNTLLAEIKELKLKLGVVTEEPQGNNKAKGEEKQTELVCKDEPPDSDSSAILNDENNPTRFFVSSEHHPLGDDEGLFVGFHHYHEEQSNRLGFEEHALLGCDEPCTASLIFSDEAHAVPWYCAEQWS